MSHNQRKARPSAKRRQVLTVLIICDGQTEENYIDKTLKSYLSSKKDIPVKFTIKRNKTIKAVETLIKRTPGIQPFEAVIFLKDLENTSLNQSECKRLNELENMTGKHKDNSYWFVLYNYPSIEFWYILHFSQCAKFFANAAEATTELKKYFPEYKKPMPTDKKESNIFLEKIEDALSHLRCLK